MADQPKSDRYFDVMSYHLERIPKNEQEEVLTEGYLLALEGRASKVYAVLFGGEGMLSNQLGGALEHDLAKIRKHYEVNKVDYETLDSMVKNEAAKLGKQKCLAEKDVAMKGLLWSTRTLNFICTLIEKILEAGGDTVRCARDTYAETLAPYHGWMGSTTFNGALGWIADEEKLLELFEYPTKEEFRTSGQEFVSHLRPLIKQNFEILDKYDVHFTYKVL
uniref:Glycolipid transfer protein domain-containing protein n=1 Tax=Aplanochytrium stocchinoi TaxID=215587 RepID=A0A7S3PNH2_9STRA|mmetsp:Transcript_9227/g.11529  ORF Transcript_9227/g.11529 Transcript_9227/m.11529 type:complete len:220 (-) Transcript_9227:1454-2113(-)|eukprot:CAMPEP_0204835968 /NCGR_PEP_ID=MMETSP1346-20131115/24146_1 /ASSEMBLY_ACC=CAM_ASM_000771 /TAXON_ID=215587 /ORGANISM="Aplanochytrium stocchinoi, Strain GSBS06" /LENGTH=219 /DNA_ID=CAMNT_0051970421 /DNA_START=146 /DNA_END=805 /DNA_ORIENTATION=-